MIRRLAPAACLALSMCATIQPYASCDTARIAAQLATVAMARICPMKVRAIE